MMTLREVVSGGNLVELVDSTLSSDGTFHFSSLPSSFEAFLVEGSLRSDRSAATDSLEINLGNSGVDTGSNYESYSDDVFGSTDVRVDTGNAADSETTGVYSIFGMIINNPGSTSYFKSLQIITTSVGSVCFTGGTWKSTSVVTDIQVTPNVGTNFKSGSHLAVYGVSA